MVSKQFSMGLANYRVWIFWVQSNYLTLIYSDQKLKIG